MFGYVTADIRALSKDGRGEYRSYYCGLCRALAARYGARARWLLSFDTVFAFIILSALEENPPQCKNSRCPYHFGQKRSCYFSEIADYAADITVILAYLNIKDDIADGGALRARMAERLYRAPFEAVSARHLQLCADIKRFLSELDDAQRHGETDYNVPADIFGRLLGRVFAYNPKAEAFGYRLGRVIYLTDAACDFKSDIKHGRYNPLLRCRMSDFDGLLCGEYGGLAAEYERLELYRAREIADNTVYSGIRLKYELIKQLRGKKNDRPL